MRLLALTWPEGKPAALTTSWDDGTIHDRRLVPLLNDSGVKGTWNLNSGRLGHNRDQTGWEDIITAEEVPHIYAGHEVACHSVNHPALANMPANIILSELIKDRECLEQLVGYPVQGLAYPFGSTSEEVRSIARQCGFVYGRTAIDSLNFQLPVNFLDWQPTYHFSDNYQDVWRKFLDPLWDGKLFFLWGHSSILGKHEWSQVENFCKKAGNHPSIWYATNMEIYTYITSWRQLRCTVDLSAIENHSCKQVWFRCEGKLYSVKPGEMLVL